ncbi:hypothetical protein CUR85_04205 [Sulfitobacter faviae]|nr:hypothetical protein [Sulfitobacter faviae]
MSRLEEQIAHLTRAVDDMSEIVTRQEAEIVTLNRRVHMLMQREGERDASGGGAVLLGDERPRITERQRRAPVNWLISLPRRRRPRRAPALRTSARSGPNAHRR